VSRYYDPSIHTPMVKFRWWFADLLNRLPWTCWANLVSWALGSKPLYDRHGDGDIRMDWICRTDFENCGACYCGKLRAAPSPHSRRPVPQHPAGKVNET
jgi:hypothetical protein